MSKTPALLSSAMNGDACGVRKLLAEKINVDVRAQDGSTALMNAAGCRRIEVANLHCMLKREYNYRDGEARQNSTSLFSKQQSTPPF